MPNRSGKICVIGGGGVRSPFVVKTIATEAASLGIGQLVLLDSDAFKLSKYGELSREIVNRIDPEIKVTLEVEPETALKDCDYIISSVRVGGDQARLKDEEIVSKYELLAQETTGACGFAMAMRSIPVIAEYCEIAKRVAKTDHLFFNFTNPAGLVTQALNTLGYPVYGICDSPSELIKQISKMLGVKESEFSCNTFGLNHLTWFNDFKVNGKDISSEVINHPELFSQTEMRIFDKDILTISDNYLLNEYLYFYFYNKKVMRLGNLSGTSRGKLINDVNLKMNSELAEIDVPNNFELAFKIYFDNYNVRENNYLKLESGVDRVKVYTTPTAKEFIERDDEGGYSGISLKFIKAYKSNQQVEMVLSVPNKGAIAELNDDDVIEVMCDIKNGEVTPRKQGVIPNLALNLIRTVKEYERLAVAAILNCDVDLAIKALIVNPLIANHDIAKSLVQEFIHEYGSFAGSWK
jgi:6-phospho-beta-glucosidase